jgi:hypothetical protein
MRSTLPVFALLAGCVCAQSVQQKTQDLVEITPDTVIATVNGQKFTAGDLERITQKLDANMRNMVSTRPKDFLSQYALSLTLQEEARKMKLPDAKPYKDQIEAAIREILVNAAITEHRDRTPLDPDEVKKAYDADKPGYKQAQVKVIFVSREGYMKEMGTGKTTATTPEEAAGKMARIAKLAREGKDFAALAKEYSDDRSTGEEGGDFPFPVRGNSTTIPDEIRRPIIAAKAGDIVGPITHTSGHYLFRIESVEQASFDSVKEEIEKNLRQGAVNRWIDELQKKATVTLDNESFWKTFLAANKPETKKPAASGGEK